MSLYVHTQSARIASIMDTTFPLLIDGGDDVYVDVPRPRDGRRGRAVSGRAPKLQPARPPAFGGAGLSAFRACSF